MSNLSGHWVQDYYDLQTFLVAAGLITLASGIKEATPTISGSSFTDISTSANIIITDYDPDKFYFNTVSSGTSTLAYDTITWQIPLAAGTFTANVYAISQDKILSDPAVQQYLRLHWGNDGYTKLLLHMDGENNGTSFIDSSQYNRSVDGSGYTKTDEKKFGTASAQNIALTIGYSPDWYFTSTDGFTIDFWIRFTSINYWMEAITKIWEGDGDGRSWMLYAKQDGGVGIGFKHIWNSGNSNNINDIFASTTISTNNWIHLALVQSGSSLLLFKDGIYIGGGSFLGNFVYDRGMGLKIGYSNSHIDEFRISKGIARWTSNFTPPTVAYY